ncbi:MAG: hypothetical protein ACTSWD_08065 [Candidatus Heimdallarchaeota archaeon]
MDKQERLTELFKQAHEGINKCEQDCNGCKVTLAQALNVIENLVQGEKRE